jgi:hypothetical protein
VPSNGIRVTSAGCAWRPLPCVCRSSIPSIHNYLMLGSGSSRPPQVATGNDIRHSAVRAETPPAAPASACPPTGVRANCHLYNARRFDLPPKALTLICMRWLVGEFIQSVPVSCGNRDGGVSRIAGYVCRGSVVRFTRLALRSRGLSSSKLSTTSLQLKIDRCDPAWRTVASLHMYIRHNILVAGL